MACTRISCTNCGLPIPDQPEDATPDMLLCDECHAEMQETEPDG